MIVISESYRKRLTELAGIAPPPTTDPFAGSEKRVPFNKDMIIQAIKEGRELGISFQSDNESYRMPVAKWRVIYAVAIGITKKGNLAIRAFHKAGQSEKEAIRTGKRSAEVQNAWRLFKVSNIKAMWFTGNFFRGPLEGYNPNGDGQLISIEIQANFPEIIKFQDNFLANMKNDQEREQKRKNIVQLFKQTGERPYENPYKSTVSTNPNDVEFKPKNQNIA